MDVEALEQAWGDRRKTPLSVRQAIGFDLRSDNPVALMLAQKKAERAGPDVSKLEPFAALTAGVRYWRAEDFLAGAYSQAGDHARASHHTVAALRYAPDWDPLAMSHVLNSAACNLRRAGLDAEATAWAERGLAYDPFYPNLLMTLGACAMRVDRARAASLYRYVVSTGRGVEDWDGPTPEGDPAGEPYAPSLAGMRATTAADVFRLMVAQAYDYGRAAHVKATALALALAAFGRPPQAALAVRIALATGGSRPHLAPFADALAARATRDAPGDAARSDALSTDQARRLGAVPILAGAHDLEGLRGLVFDDSRPVSWSACAALADAGHGGEVRAYVEIAAELEEATAGGRDYKLKPSAALLLRRVDGGG